MSRFKKIGAYTLALSTVSSLGIASLCLAQAVKTEKQKQGEQAFVDYAQRMAIENQMRHRLESGDWQQDEWTGDNKPFRAITQEVALLIKRKQLQNAISRFKEEAQAHPVNAQAQYRYILAGFSLEMQSYPVDVNKTIRWREDLLRPDPPHALDYSRLQFLVEVSSIKSTKPRKLGDRILKEFPNDEWVSFFVERLQEMSTESVDIQKNLDKAYLKLKSDPNDKYALSRVMDERMKLWVKSNTRDTADQAIAAYRRYQQILPADSLDIARIEARILDIDQSQHKYDSKKS